MIGQFNGFYVDDLEFGVVETSIPIEMLKSQFKTIKCDVNMKVAPRNKSTDVILSREEKTNLC